MTTQVRSGAMALVASMAILLTGCATSPEDAESKDRYSAEPIVLSGLPWASRAKEYESLEDLAKGSELVVVARSTGETLQLDPYSDEEVQFGVMTLVTTEVLAGDLEAGSKVLVSLEAGPDGKGGLATNKLTHEDTYTLFLNPVGQLAPDVYAVTGYLAGIYQRIGDTEYHKIDPESPHLPTRVELDTLRTAARAS